MTVLKKLLPAHRKLFESYLSLKPHAASVYRFENIILWDRMYEIRWLVVDKNLCIFFRDRLGLFLYLPPLGHRISEEALRVSWEMMDAANNLPEISRIENLEEKETVGFRGRGEYRIVPKGPEYVYARKQIAALSGGSYKAKRANVNYFLKHHAFRYRPFSLRDAWGCERLFSSWMRERARQHTDRLYRGLLDDSFAVFKRMLSQYRNSAWCGSVVCIDNVIRACTFGYPLNAHTFCVFFEVADLSHKGLAQFIFRQFCSELKPYSFINVMDDSGLDNLKRVKRSYKPYRLVKLYNVTRAH